MHFGWACADRENTQSTSARTIELLTRSTSEFRTTPAASQPPLLKRGGEDERSNIAFPSSNEEGWRPKAAGVVMLVDITSGVVMVSDTTSSPISGSRRPD